MNTLLIILVFLVIALHAHMELCPNKSYLGPTLRSSRVHNTSQKRNTPINGVWGNWEIMRDGMRTYQVRKCHGPYNGGRPCDGPARRDYGLYR